ncbi:unnamed protein product, partial [Urochloa humidicola]
VHAERPAGEQTQQKNEDAGKEQEGSVVNQQPEAKKTGKKKITRNIVKRKGSASGSQLTAPATRKKQTSKKQKFSHRKMLRVQSMLKILRLSLKRGQKLLLKIPQIRRRHTRGKGAYVD